jgi:hypothetical protein
MHRDHDTDGDGLVFDGAGHDLLQNLLAGMPQMQVDPITVKCATAWCSARLAALGPCGDALGPYMGYHQNRVERAVQIARRLKLYEQETP